MTPRETLDLTKVYFTNRKIIPRREFAGLNAKRLQANLDIHTGKLILTLDAYIWGLEKERIDVSEKWPTDWWEAFKERWFPQWILSRFPVTYKSFELHQHIFGKVCPHLNVVSPDNKIHMEWLSGIPESDLKPSE